MRKWLFGLLVVTGCGGAGEATLKREMDPALRAGEVPRAVAAYQRAGRHDARRLRLAAETVVWAELSSPSAAERLRATRLVAELADATLDRALPARLVDPDSRVRAVAAAVLASQAEAARPVLAQSFASPDAETRLYALDGIDALADPAAMLDRLAHDADARVRGRVADELARRDRLGARAAAALLSTLVADADAGVRASALRAAGARGDQALLGACDRALGDPSLGVRLAALSSLARLDGTPGRLSAIAMASDRFVALRAAVQLSRLGRLELAKAEVGAAATAREAPLRVAAMNAAGELGAAGAELARPALADASLEVRLAAARALVATGHVEEARPVLVAALSSPARLDAADELARLGDARGRAALEDALRSPDARVRRRALALYAPLPGSAPSLVQALADADADVRLTAAETLLRRAYRPGPTW